MLEDISASISYANLPIEVKQQILDNLKRHKRLPTGFYSQTYSIKIEEDLKLYRFHSTIRNNQPVFILVFEQEEPKHAPLLKGNTISFYDVELQRSLYIDKDMFEEQVENEINYELSSEELELLAEGKEITIEIKLNKPTNEIPVYLRNKNIKKTISVDYNFFLGKISLLLNINETKKNNLSLKPKVYE